MMNLLLRLSSVCLLIGLACAETDNSVSANSPTRLKVVVSGDVQFRSGWDYWSGGLDKRKPVIAGLASEKADVVLLNGDLVEKGADTADWKMFDEEMKPLIQNTPLFLASIGNHDIKGNNDKALDNFFGRIKAAKGHRYYSLQRGPILFLILNSNEPLNPGSPQRKWVADQLAAVPNSVKYVVTSMHHPMRTRSRQRGLTRGHEVLPEHKEFGTWLESIGEKATYRIISFSGHVHNYERYPSDGVMFIVSGGAGGRPHDVERDPGDAYTGTGPTYHYCILQATASDLRFVMRHYDTKQQTWSDGDSFTLKAK
jgi:hypothetical protein